jgi:flagellar transcriptional activator FlhD
MSTDQLMNDIRDANLSLLMLAQHLIRTDKAQALYRLGLSEAVADLIAQLSPQQLLRVASRGVLMCTMRFNDETIWALLSEPRQPANTVASSMNRLHASVLMAGHASACAA